MGAFEFEALNAQGRAERGVLQADTARSARQQLRQRGLSPLAVSALQSAEQQRRSPGGRISSMELAVLMRQLSTLTGAGTPIEEALSTASEQAEKRRVKRVLAGVRASIAEGQSLAEALGTYPQTFPSIYRASVDAGERSGHLGAVLERLAHYAESRDELRRGTILAAAYPVALVILSILIVAGLMTYVVPEVISVFDQAKDELPLLTRGMIAVSDFLAAWGGILLLALALTAGAVWLALQQPRLRLAWHHILQKLPLVGRIGTAINTARFTRTLSILVASSVPVLESLGIAAQVIKNLAMQQGVKQAATAVREGQSLHQALTASGYFPPMTTRLVATGESGGRLAELLDAAAEHQEKEVRTTTAVLMTVIEPLMILFVGALVLTIVLAILLPVLELNQRIS